jgi:hypothetical protein
LLLADTIRRTIPRVVRVGAIAWLCQNFIIGCIFGRAAVLLILLRDRRLAGAGLDRRSHGHGRLGDSRIGRLRAGRALLVAPAVGGLQRICNACMPCPRFLLECSSRHTLSRTIGRRHLGGHMKARFALNTSPCELDVGQ